MIMQLFPIRGRGQGIGLSPRLLRSQSRPRASIALAITASGRL